MPRSIKLGLLAALAVSVSVLLVASASGTLSGSAFESSDGNLVVNASGSEDWANAPGRTVQTDLTGSSQDNAFGQGAKEDIPNPSVVSGSIPPNKSDLSRFYTSTEKASNSHTYLYLAWERTNVLGSANMDFELNQSAVADLNGVTPVRTAGDLLFTYDFTNGGSRPTLGMLTWLTSGPASACYASNAIPCWGSHVDLAGAGFADGSINPASTTDPISGQTLPGGTFGEMGVDLTLALPNVFGANPTSCDSFGSAYLKSRSSASFTAEIKDFIAPQATHVSNCGSLLIRKTASNTQAGQAGARFTASPGSTNTSGVTASTSDFTDEGNGWYCIDNMLLNQSTTVTEASAPANYDIASNSPQTVTVTNPNSCSTRAGAPVADVGLTFVDTPQLGAVTITKTAKNHTAGSAQAVNGAVFNVFSGASSSTGQKGGDLTTAGSGTVCIANLPFGTYTIHEKSAPSGYSLASDMNVSVTANGTCTTGTQAAANVSDLPLTNVAVVATGQVAGATASTIVCKDASNNVVGTSVSSPVDPASETLTGLTPGTYSCTIVVDP